MRMTIDINEKLLAEAQKQGDFKTKKATVEKALQLLVQLKAQKKILNLIGKVEFYDDVS